MRKPKLSNILSQRKNCVKSVRKQYGNPDSHPFFSLLLNIYFPFSRWIATLRMSHMVVCGKGRMIYSAPSWSGSVDDLTIYTRPTYTHTHTHTHLCFILYVLYYRQYVTQTKEKKDTKHVVMDLSNSRVPFRAGEANT